MDWGWGGGRGVGGWGAGGGGPLGPGIPPPYLVFRISYMVLNGPLTSKRAQMTSTTTTYPRKKSVW
jgi:hypothetical protein